MSEGEFLITQKEAADFLQVSTKSISRYRKRGLPHQFILNPVTGKQEVRFRRVDLERWHEGRQLLATYGRDGEEAAAPGPQAGGRPSPVPRADDQGFLNELLAVYREEIEILRDQVEDLREQLARRDRQIDDLMRLMVGLQLEYKPLAAQPADAATHPGGEGGAPALEPGPSTGVYEAPIVIDLPPGPPPPVEPAQAFQPRPAGRLGARTASPRQELRGDRPRFEPLGRGHPVRSAGMDRGRGPGTCRPWSRAMAPRPAGSRFERDRNRIQ